MTKLLKGDCLEVLKTLPDNSIDAVVTDPPYGISFMSKKWDYSIPAIEVWEEVIRVLKPGGHALIACGTRTQHRMACNIEDAGFEIRDVVSWIYGSGFPKSHNISKAIDKLAGAEREVVGKAQGKGGENLNKLSREDGDNSEDAKGCGAYGMGAKQVTIDIPVTAPATDEAKQWDGWGTALKPAQEFFTLCRKPLSAKTVAKNVLKWGTGGINVDGCRVPLDGDYKSKPNGRPSQTGLSDNYNADEANKPDTQGRFPANLIHDGSQEVLELFPESKGQQGDVKSNKNTRESPDGRYGKMPPAHDHPKRSDSGSAARFFYSPKVSKKERNEGCPDGNHHPTVKPLALMSYLIKLITAPEGTVLDPYMGSGTTGVAAENLGRSFIGIEKQDDYFQIARSRMGAPTPKEN